VVKPGDTLGSIAKSELQDEGRRFDLASLNDLRDNAELVPGTRLKLRSFRGRAHDGLKLTPPVKRLCRAHLRLSVHIAVSHQQRDSVAEQRAAVERMFSGHRPRGMIS